MFNGNIEKDYFNLLKAINNGLSTCTLSNPNRISSYVKRHGIGLSLHAEENALIKYKERYNRKEKNNICVRKLHIVVIRINKNNELIDSKPCTHCVFVMKEHGIRKVSYSTNDGIIIKENINNIVPSESSGYCAANRAMTILKSMV